MSNIKSDQVNELAKALANVQSQLKPAVKNKINPFFKSAYADLVSVWEACQPLLAANGLAVTQTTQVENGVNLLVTTLMHISGQWVEGRYAICAKSADPQAQGSAITYARRYALCAIVGVIADEDDDGNAAQEPDRAATTKATTKPAAASTEKAGPASDAQLKKLYAMKEGAMVTDAAIKAEIKKRFAKTSSKELTWIEVKQLYAWLDEMKAELDATK